MFTGLLLGLWLTWYIVVASKGRLRWLGIARVSVVFVCWVHMVTVLSSAATAALKSALQREHGGLTLHVLTVEALVTYFAGRGEALTDLPLEYPSRGSEDFERRWGWQNCEPRL